MKKLHIIVLLMFFSIWAMGQTKENKKIEQVGDLFEVTIYYDNGEVMQHGFLTKDNKLHASWESFYDTGERKCVATYDNGVKVGTWFYYYADKETRVVYEDNKIVESEERPLD